MVVHPPLVSALRCASYRQMQTARREVFFFPFLYICNLQPVVRVSLSLHLNRLPSMKKGVVLVLTCQWPLSPPSVTPSLTVTELLISVGAPASTDTPDSSNHSALAEVKNTAGSFKTCCLLLQQDRLVDLVAVKHQGSQRGIRDRLSVPRDAGPRLLWLAAERWRLCLAGNCSSVVQAVCHWQRWWQGEVVVRPLRCLRCHVYLTFIYPRRICQAPNLGLNNTQLHIHGVTYCTFTPERFLVGLSEQIQLHWSRWGWSTLLKCTPSHLLRKKSVLLIFFHCSGFPGWSKVLESEKEGIQIWSGELRSSL